MTRPIKSNSEASIRAKLAAFHAEYLDGCPEGGTSDGFVDFVFNKTVTGEIDEAEHRALFKIALKWEWGKKTETVHKAERPEQGTLAGLAPPSVLTVKDSTVPGGYRKVAARHATVAHVVAHRDVIQDNSDRVMASLQLTNQFTDGVLARANGNMDAKLIDLLD